MSQAGSGLLASIRRLLSTLTEIATTRLELLGNELYEERLRIEQMLLYFFSALFLLALGVLMLTALIVVLFWDEHRVAALAVLSLIFFVSGTLVAKRFLSLSQTKSRLFSASLAELQKDRMRLGDERE